VFINNHRKVKIVGIILFQLTHKHFLFLLFDLKDELRLETHIVIPLDSFDLDLIVVLIVFYFFGESELVNNQAVKFSIPSI